MDGKFDPPAVATAASIAIASPLAGDYALIVVGALLGALVALSRMDYRQWARLNSAAFVFRCVVISVGISAAFAEWLSGKIGLNAHHLLIPVSIVIAAIGDDWFKAKEWLFAKLGKKE